MADYEPSEGTPPSREPRKTGQFSKRWIAVKAIIDDLAKRYPLPNGATPQDHNERLDLLARDCEDIDPYHLRAAAQRAARECRFLPTAAELRALAKDATASVDEDWGQRRARQFNLDNIASGSPVRAQVKSGNWEFFRPGSPAEKRRCDGRGGVIAPWFSEAKKQWIYPDGTTA